MHTKALLLFRLFSIFCITFGIYYAPNTLFQFTSTAYGASNQTSLPNSIDSTDYKDVLIRFRAESSLAERDAYLAQISGELLLWIEPLHTAHVRVPSSLEIENEIVVGESISPDSATEDAVTSASIHSIALSVEEDGVVYGTFEPNDPDLYREQRVYTTELLGLFEAWDYTVGVPDVTIAVLDTGIASAHQEFTGRIKPGYDFYNDDDDPEDDHGHGTHVSGTIAAGIDNGIGGAGLCGGCSILPIKVLNQNNAGTWAGVAAGITYAADNDADIIVMSLGSTSGTRVVEDAISYAISKDVLIIAAAGNANSNRNFYPAAYDGVIGVAATNQNDERWVLSNYGSYVDISAPGHVIYSTSNDLDNSYNGHVFMSGTSMATPHVGGLAGLLKSQDLTRSSTEIADILLNTALDLGDPGYDDYFGMGRIDPVAALTYELSVQPTAELGGSVWYDMNADGQLGANEKGQVAGVDITILNAQKQIIATTTSNEDGTWKIADLKAGTYQISATSGDSDMILTTPNYTSVTLSPGQQLLNKMIGFVDELPSSVVTDVKAYRHNNDVIVFWQIASNLVTGLKLERSIGDGDYELLKQYDLALVGVADESSQSFVDTLPDNIDDQVISYRIQITPGETYISTFKAIDQPADGPITAIAPDVNDRTVDELVVFVPLMFVQK